MPRGPRLIVSLAMTWLCACWTVLAAAEDFAFYHENVMGTSLELRVAGRRCRGGRGRPRTACSRDRSALARSSAATTRERVPPLAGRAAGAGEVSPELFELLSACDDWRTGAAGPSIPGSRR